MKPKLTTIDASDFPSDPEVPASVSQHFAEGTPVMLAVTPGGGLLATGVKPDSMAQETLTLHFANADAAPKTIELAEGFYVAQALSPDGTRAIVVHRQNGNVIEIALPACTTKEVFANDGLPQAASYLDGDHVAYLTDSTLFLLARDGDTMKASAQMKLEDMSGLATAGDLIALTARDDKLRIIATKGGALKEVGKVAAKARVIVGHGGKLFLTNHRFPNKRTAFFTVDGLAG